MDDPFFHIVALLSFPALTYGQSATIFADECYGGMSLDITAGPACKNVPEYWNDLASSIKVYTGCIEIFQNYDCVPKIIRVSKDAPFLRKFHKYSLDNMLSSYRNCRGPPDRGGGDESECYPQGSGFQKGGGGGSPQGSGFRQGGGAGFKQGGGGGFKQGSGFPQGGGGGFKTSVYQKGSAKDFFQKQGGGVSAGGQIEGSVGGQVEGSAGTQMDISASGGVDVSTAGQVDGSAGGQVDGSAGGGVDVSAGGQVDGSAGGQVDGSAGGGADGSIGGQVDGSAGGGVDVSAGGQVDVSAGGQVDGSAGGEVDGSAGEGGEATFSF